MSLFPIKHHHRAAPDPSTYSTLVSFCILCRRNNCFQLNMYFPDCSEIFSLHRQCAPTVLAARETDEPQSQERKKRREGRRRVLNIGSSIHSLPILMQCSRETQGVYSSLTAECFTIKKFY